MKKLKYILFTLSLLLAAQMVTPTTVQAQCPMCKMSAESNLKAGGTAGKGLNAGILYMLVMPYILVGSIGFIWYRNRKREEDEDFYAELESINQEG